MALPDWDSGVEQSHASLDHQAGNVRGNNEWVIHPIAQLCSVNVDASQPPRLRAVEPTFGLEDNRVFP